MSWGVAGLVSLYVRFRRALRAERQQIKWLAYAGTVLLTGTILLYAGPESLSGSWSRQVGFALWVISFVGLPVAIGIAILKYRLYNIDLIINRTLVYGSLTATLVALYFGGVATTQAIFQALAGQEEQPQLAIVVSTLVIAALFTPPEASDTGLHRQALLPKEVRRQKDAGGILCQAQGRDGPGRLERRLNERGKGDDAASARLLVAAPRYTVEG